MNAALREAPHELARFIARSARNQIPIVVTLDDGSTVTGRIIIAWVDSILVEAGDGDRVRVTLDAIDRITRKDGRTLWARS